MGQGEDPAVADIKITPHKIIQLNQEIVISFKIGNIGSGSITGASEYRKISFDLNFSKLKLKESINLLQNISGSGAEYFDFTILPEANYIHGKQKNKPFTASDMQDINISFIYSGTANNINYDIGCRINVRPPGGDSGIAENDNASVYTSLLSGNCPTALITPSKVTLSQSNSAIITTSSGTSYQWYRNNIKIPGATTASLTVTEAGIYNAVIFNESCSKFTQNNCEVIVDGQPPVPVPELTFSYYGTHCSQQSLFFLYRATPLPFQIQTLIWDFGNGEKKYSPYNNADVSVSQLFTKAGTYIVKLTGITHSGDSIFSKPANIVIKHSPIVLSISQTALTCYKKEFSANLGANEEQSVTSFVWQFDVNGAGINGNSKIVHSFEKNSYYGRLQVINHNGCTTDKFFNPNVYSPDVDFSIPDTVCLGQTIALTGQDKNMPQANHTMNWKWKIGNNEAEYNQQNATHTFIKPGNKDITLSLTPDGSPYCVSTVTKTIHIIAAGAFLDFQLPSLICDTNRISLTAINLTPSIPVNNWKWYSNSKAIGEGSSINFEFEDEGEHKIELTATTTGSSCISKKEKITSFIKQVIIPDYDFYIPDTIFAGEEITLKAIKISDHVENDFQFLWYLNDSPIGAGKTYTRRYNNDGLAKLTLVISSNNNCNTTKKISKNIAILPLFDVNIYTSGNSCVDTDIEIYTKTIASREYEIKDYVWRIDNIEVGRGKYLTHKFVTAKTYDVTLQTISDNPYFNVTKSGFILVYNNPEIDFGIRENVNNLCSGNSISLVGLLNKWNTYVHDWRWTVNNEKIEPAYNNASITPTKDGDYVISLKAVDTHGCWSNTVTKAIYIKPSPEIDIDISNILCIGDTVVARPIVKNASTTKLINWSWTSSGDSFDYSKENFKVRFKKISDAEHIMLRATGENGCVSNTVYKDLSVQYGTEAKYSVSKNKICIGDTITIKDISTTNNPNSTFVERYWNFAYAHGFSYEPPSSYPNILTGKFSSHGEKKFELVTRNSTGCLSISTPIPIEVLNNPFLGIGIRYDSIIQYADNPLQFQARNAGSTAQYLWKPQVGLNNYNIINPVFNHNQTRDYFVDIFYNDDCKVTDTLNIRVITQFNIHVPGGFSPNGDNNNDVLKPILVGITKLNYFRVFNQQNQLLYETTITGNGWDGTYKGNKQPVGSYIWIVEGIDINGNIIRRKGSTILIK